jgi:hypothetical protein
MFSTTKNCKGEIDDDPYFYYYPKFGIFKQEVMNSGLDAVYMEKRA